MATTTPAAEAGRPKMGRYIALGAIALIVIWLISAYNGIVTADETVNQKWGDVESNYKRRFDLIDNLVSTVKGAADFEKGTLIAVQEARSKATGITVDPSNASPEQIKAFMDAQSQVGSTLSRLLVAVENYPTLSATQNFRDLQSQIEGTENRINVARENYNAAVKDLNSRVRRFPGNIVASVAGVHTRNTFDAPEETETAPKVDFGTK